MGLKSDIQQSFEDNLADAGEISDVAALIVDNYKTSVEGGFDTNNNKWQGIQFKVIESAIVAQFTLSFNTKSYLQFTLIESALVAAWATATLKLPAIPAPGMSVVNSGIVVVSTPTGTTPLVEASDGYDNIVNKFYDVFTNHSKTLVFNYIGLSTSSPPVSIVVPSSSFMIK